MFKNSISKILFTMVFTAVASLPALASLSSLAPPRKQLMMRLVEGSAVLSPLAHVRFCMMHPAECIGNKGGPDVVELNDLTMMDLATVNARVNRSIRPQAKDPTDFMGTPWSLAPEAGDCNDYAVTKRRQLLDLGWPSSAVLLATARTSWGEGHLVVVVRTDKGDFVLDNLHANVMPMQAMRYSWIAVQSASDPRLWRSALRRLV